MPIAITRQVSPCFAECELTFAERVPIDIPLANTQHLAYTQALESLGYQVLSLPALPDYPDSVFVEDAAFILPEIAVITRPGAESRRGEIDQSPKPSALIVSWFSSTSQPLWMAAMCWCWARTST